MQPWKKLSLEQADYSIDGMPVISNEMRFDGSNTKLAEGERIRFKNPNTEVWTDEKVHASSTLGTNGTYIFTPSACDDQFSGLDVNAIQKQGPLEGKPLVIDLGQAVEHEVDEIRRQLTTAGITNFSPHETAEYIVLFRTGIMQGVLSGNKVSKKFGIAPQTAQFLADLNLARAYCIDSQSFETPEHQGFPTSQILQNAQGTEFTPLIYQLINLDQLSGQESEVRIEIGSPPPNEPSWPVSIWAK